jgi:hypothetical protein
MASKKKVLAVVGMLCEAFRRKATDLTYEAYHLVLGDVTDEQLEVAGTAALRSTGDFMPTAGQLRELALLGGVSVDARAETAWQEFDKAVARAGADYSVSFDDGLINATVRSLGGWVWCCEREGDAYHVWLRKEFLNTYKRFCKDGASEDLRRPHSGRLSQQNASFPAEILQKLNAYTGDAVEIGTSQPVIQGPTKPYERIGVGPTLQLKHVED